MVNIKLLAFLIVDQLWGAEVAAGREKGAYEGLSAEEDTLHERGGRWKGGGGGGAFVWGAFRAVEVDFGFLEVGGSARSFCQQSSKENIEKGKKGKKEWKEEHTLQQ
jgi:hypothetical protein